MAGNYTRRVAARQDEKCEITWYSLTIAGGTKTTRDGYSLLGWQEREEVQKDNGEIGHV